MTVSAKVLTRRLLAAGAILLAIQFVPYGRAHRNPPVVQEPKWDHPSTRLLAARACFDCHSNETEWPWYSDFAPVSWVLARHVGEGRETLNFSEWQGANKEAREAAESVSSGEMPPASYLLMHPSARLSPEEKRLLVQGLAVTVGSKERGAD